MVGNSGVEHIAGSNFEDTNQKSLVFSAMQFPSWLWFLRVDFVCVFLKCLRVLFYLCSFEISQ